LSLSNRRIQFKMERIQNLAFTPIFRSTFFLMFWMLKTVFLLGSSTSEPEIAVSSPTKEIRTSRRMTATIVTDERTSSRRMTRTVTSEEDETSSSRITVSHVVEDSETSRRMTRTVRYYVRLSSKIF